MDALVRIALKRVNEALKDIPWAELEGARAAGILSGVHSDEVTGKLSKAIRSVDALRSALKSVS